ncbi:SDR family NAD(P)-dependent oxidoreductase [Ralstonia mannitolilytica]|uniref:SDR family NAD(P)-dependent oxidoreductase n=1 Tax=Ralstonia mannitolilytica TaxID=105219 RepID=UPI0028F6AC9B|nr:hypothetical protein R76727_04284 [Ralstonia mannitolilytica]
MPSPIGTALVTGASSGIGAIYADRLAARGHDLLLVARNEDRLRAQAEKLGSRHGVKVDIMVADLTDRADLRTVETRLATDQWISVLVNNAGFGGASTLAQSAVDDMERMIDVNVTAIMRLCYAAAPAFVARGTGTIINIASIVAIAPEILNGVYGGSKAFVLAFSRSLKKELAETGVKVQVVLPGATGTAFWDTAGMPDDGRGLDEGGSGATAYAQAVGLYLAFALNKLADRGSSICTWFTERDSTRNTFARQSIPMTWDFAELNTLLSGTGSFTGAAEWTSESIEGVAVADAIGFPSAIQADAQSQTISSRKVISTDPPYYDNIGYADLSDFFYVWLRKSLKPIFPGLYATVAVPKAEELVATPYRHGGKEQAEKFFLDGMTEALRNLARQAHPAFPVTIYYAFKQSETKGEAGTSSTGWETFLEAVLKAGFALTGTWPMRTELGNRMIGSGTNALASSIVLVCRQRPADAPTVSRREFIRELNTVLPEALLDMTRGGVNSPVAPVDLSQAIIGPGMAIFSQYAAVLEADGTPMSVRTALQLINRFLAEDDFDHDTQFCLHWFEQQGWATGKYGDADVLARAKGTSVDGLVQAGVVESAKGELRLLKWAEMPRDWSPESDTRLPVWEALHQLIRALNQEGETAAGALLSRMPARAEPIRALAYRLYTLCERKGWAEEARAYNELVTAWSAIEQAAGEAGVLGSQGQLEI